MDIKWKIEHLDIIRQGIEQEKTKNKNKPTYAKDSARWTEMNTVLHHINEALKKKY